MKPIRPFTATLAALLVAPAMLAGCDAASQPRSAAPAAAAANRAAVDPFELMALDAGKDLIGRRAPDLVLTTLEGRQIRIGRGQSGRPVYLKFWATWCVTCREQMDAFKADWQRHAQDIDIVAVDTGVNDDRAAVEAYRRDVGLPMPVAIDDGRLAEAFHLKVTPQQIVIGRDGVVRHVGHLEDDRLHAALRDAVAERTVSRPAAADVQGPGAVPQAAPATLRSVQGSEVAIDGPAAGAPRLLYFFSPWCESYLKDSRPTVAADCRRTREALMRAAAGSAYQVIGIASGLSSNADGVRRYLDRTAFQAPVVVDGDGRLFRRFGVLSFPVVIRLDDRGRPTGRLTPDQVDGLGRGA